MNCAVLCVIFTSISCILLLSASRVLLAREADCLLGTGPAHHDLWPPRMASDHRREHTKTGARTQESAAVHFWPPAAAPAPAKHHASGNALAEH
jgi:hypothetical protein